MAALKIEQHVHVSSYPDPAQVSSCVRACLRVQECDFKEVVNGTCLYTCFSRARKENGIPGRALALLNGVERGWQVKRSRDLPTRLRRQTYGAAWGEPERTVYDVLGRDAVKNDGFVENVEHTMKVAGILITEERDITIFVCDSRWCTFI